MRKLSKSLRPLLIAWIIGIFASGGFLSPSALQAQNSATPRLQITDVDIEAFPLISVTVYAEALDDSLDASSIRLLEDRVEQPQVNNQTAAIGVQTAIVIDASRNILSIGNTGDPRLAEVSRSVGQFVQLGLLSAQTDWLAAYGTGTEADTYEVIADWQQDHQGVVNSLIQWRPEDRPVITSLFGIVHTAFAQFESAPAPPNTRRSMVLFSDGADIVSNIEADDIVRMAKRLDLRIHTVLLGTPARDSRRNLGRLADLTGGIYVELETVDDLEPIWRSIASERVQQIITYRLDQAQPQEIQVALNLPNGREISDTQPFPVVGARPVEIEIISPLQDEPFVRVADAPNTPLAAMEPASLLIQVEFTWPDEHPRDFLRTEFSIDGDVRAVESGTFERFNFPVTGIAEGNHTIRVAAVDELGITSNSAPVSVPFQSVYAESNAVDTRQKQSANGSTVKTVASIRSGESANGSSVNASSANALPANATSASEGASPNATVLSDGLRIGDMVLPPFVLVGGYAVPINLSTIGMVLLPILLLICVSLLVTARKQTQSPFNISGEQGVGGLYPGNQYPGGSNDNRSNLGSPSPANLKPNGPYTGRLNPNGLNPGGAQQATGKSANPYADLRHPDLDAITVPSVSAFEMDEVSTEAVRMLEFDVVAHLVLHSGANHLPEKFPLQEGQQMRIGRHSSYSDIILEDTRVSRQHATLEWEKDAYTIRDEGSAGGTYVNKRRLRVGDLVRLADGDIINFNEIAFRYETVPEEEV